ncbi:interferon regulatory factor 3 isoform X2 [Ambystoma mexicanum]|uniref:interferon regulatory factor 3 isoform X2 n=1 Tax=Ambystoma mexicanum TaxID=8296 RepID=UPI0037E91CA4
MSAQKPLIIPWLTRQIGNPEYPGLTWTNPEHTQFRIPWKHGLRHDRSNDDFKIFEAWAIASGTYQPGRDEPRPSVWKRNLRSALNRKSEVKLIADCSSDSGDPHKIYEVLSQGPQVSEETQEQSESESPWSDVDNLELMRRALEDLDPARNALSEPAVETYPAPVLEPTPEASNLLEQFFPDNTPIECYGVPLVPDQIPQAVNPLEQFYQNNTLAVETYPAPVLEPTPEASNLLEQFCPDNPPIECYAVPLVPDQFQQAVNPLEQFYQNNTLVSDFEVNVFYRGNNVLSTTVKNPRGFRLTSSRDPGPRGDLEDIVLPEPWSIVRDQEVAKMIAKLLQNLVPGVLLEVRGGSICGMRMGKCKGFWTMSQDPQVGLPQEVQKEEFTPLHTLQQFVAELISFIQHERRDSPLYSIWLCLGEHWPDSSLKPWTKKFIMVQVSPPLLPLPSVCHSCRWVLLPTPAASC